MIKTHELVSFDEQYAEIITKAKTQWLTNMLNYVIADPI